MNIERKFYTEMLKEIMDNNWDDVRELLHTKGQSEKYIQVLSPEKIKWFENLQKYVLTFAKNGRLDVKMYTSDDWCGIIRFETSYFELSDFDNVILRNFWGYLCQTGQLSITHKETTFMIEFTFKLYDTVTK